MNPETKYPELKTMEPDEMFVEWVYAVKWVTEKKSEVIRIPARRIIKRKDRDIFTSRLREKYNATEINLATITK